MIEERRTQFHRRGHRCGLRGRPAAPVPRGANGGSTRSHRLEQPEGRPERRSRTRTMPITDEPNATSSPTSPTPEVDALLDACDLTTWTGRRDHAMFALTIQTGLRISELTNIYLHADMTHKQQAIDRTKPLATKPGRYRPPDSLLAFLEALLDYADTACT